MHRPHVSPRDAKHRLRRFLPLAILPVLVVMTSCTRGQLARWVEWHQQDPAAAEAFANQPEVQALLQRGQQSAPAPASSGGGGTVWDRLAQCESGGNWAIATGNGYFGGLQFLPSTWHAYGGSGMPHEASREEQIAVAERVQNDVGWGAWPACTRRMGLR